MRKDEDFFDKCPHLSQIIPTTSFSHIQSVSYTHLTLPTNSRV